MDRIVILVSGRGSNMQALVNACQSQQWPAGVQAVISNDPSAPALAWAAERGIATRAVNHRDYNPREQFDAALAQVVSSFAPDWVLLAGFMRVLGAAFVRRFEGRLLNIHPSLLPSFKGLHTHARALEAGVKVHGATVHLVSPELDSGAILAQAVTPVRSDDTESSLAQAVLAAEHRLYPMVVAALVRRELRIDGGVPQWQGPAGRAPSFWVSRD